ncbi:carboxypeptidase regulatory-like domain-containing protein [Desulfobacterales bacterium HSG2]|nr:carboxypeptidase regulatory-like domain-containing protein [Desulfobacterales bacterium HSG2]
MIGDGAAAVAGYAGEVASAAESVKKAADEVVNETEEKKSARASRRDDRLPFDIPSDCTLYYLYQASGVINDGEGNPIPGVTVQIESISTTTDDAGAWEIIALNNGDYTLTATKDGYEFGAVEFSVRDEDVSVSVSVTNGHDDPDCEVATDLNRWTREGDPEKGNWIVEEGGESVLFRVQDHNSPSPALFVSPEPFVNKTVSGKFVVETEYDDDYVGFVFGYQGIDDFYLLRWRQGQDNDWTTSGFTLAHVTGGLSGILHEDQHTSVSGYEVLGTKPEIPWADKTPYEFTLDYRSDSIRIDIAGGDFGDGTTIFNLTGEFPEARFGLFNFSQDNTRYEGITQKCTESDPPDSDNDGVADTEDAFPNDPNEQVDTDGDGTGNNADTDDDNDGMPDAWEVEYGLNPLADDASEDKDGDDFSNLKEYEQNTDPTDPDDPGAAPADFDGDGVADTEDAFPNNPNEQADTDGDGTGNNADTDDDNDGMPDAWEAEYGLNPLADDASEDSDGDEYSNLREYEGETDPNDSDSHPKSAHSLPMYIGDVDGFGFGGAEGYNGAYGGPADRDGDGLLGADDVLPDLNGNGKVAAKSGDNFDNRSTEETNDISGSQWTDVALSRGYSEKPGLARDASFTFRFTVDSDYPNYGKEHYVSFVYGDYGVNPMKAVVEGEEVKLKGNRNGGFDGYIWRAHVPVAWEDMTDGEVTIKIKAPNEPYVAFDYAVLDIEPISTPDDPPESPFTGGVYIADEEGIVKVDWLYDGGAYKGELGIFSLKGMEDTEPGSEEFIAESVRRVLSDSEEGHIVLSDPTEGARFSGSLGEPTDWNSGEYKGVRSFEMRPGDWFATILVPSGTFGALANNPGTTSPYLRPLFSLVSTNPAHGMYLGQIADVSDMGMAYSYEDMSADSSDRDYNDLIIQITGATIDDVPSIDDLTGTGKRSRAKRDDRTWFDWRSGTELGETIMEHLDAGIVGPETVWLSADINTDAELLAYSPDGGMIGQIGGHIPGATFGTDIDGYRFVSLPSLEEGDYRLVIRSEQDEDGLLTVRKHRGRDGILSEESGSVTLGAHETLVTDVAVYDAGDGIGIDVSQADESPAGPYDFDGNGEIDDEDIEAVSVLWNICDGDEGYKPFYDLDDDGCVTVLDIMSVVNSKSAP